MNMNLLAVLTPPSIYHDCYTQKTLWKENFTLGEITAMNMKNCSRHNVRKHREIRGIDKYVTLDILLNFDSLDKMKITSSKSKDNLVISVKGMISFRFLKAKVRPHIYKKARYAIRKVSKKYLSKIIREF